MNSDQLERILNYCENAIYGYGLICSYAETFNRLMAYCDGLAVGLSASDYQIASKIVSRAVSVLYRSIQEKSDITQLGHMLNEFKQFGANLVNEDILKM